MGLETSGEDVTWRLVYPKRGFPKMSPGGVCRKRILETSHGDVSAKRFLDKSPGDVSWRRFMDWLLESGDVSQRRLPGAIPKTFPRDVSNLAGKIFVIANRIAESQFGKLAV